jgi:hypothetical protein
LQIIRWRWIELFFYFIGYLFLVWAALGNPTQSALITISGQVSDVKVAPHVFGSRTVMFHANHSKLLKYDSGIQVDQLIRLLKSSPHVDARVWAGATAPDNDYFVGEVVELSIDGRPFMSYASWWRSHAADLAVRVGLGFLFGGCALWYLAYRPPMSAEAGRKLSPSAMGPAPRSFIATILVSSAAVFALLVVLVKS